MAAGWRSCWPSRPARHDARATAWVRGRRNRSYAASAQFVAFVDGLLFDRLVGGGAQRSRARHAGQRTRRASCPSVRKP